MPALSRCVFLACLATRSAEVVSVGRRCWRKGHCSQSLACSAASATRASGSRRCCWGSLQQPMATTKPSTAACAHLAWVPCPYAALIPCLLLYEVMHHDTMLCCSCVKGQLALCQ